MPAPIHPAAAASRLLALKKASQSFEDFIRLRHPDWELPAFQQLLIKALDLLEKNELYNDFLDQYVIDYARDARNGKWQTTLRDKGPQDPKRFKIRNVMINEPPRHAKSTFATIEFPAYYMLRRPDRYTMSVSYNDKLATGFGRQVREIVQDPDILKAFPEFALSKESRSAEEWRSDDGGAYFSIGLGGTTSGRPATLLDIDDPIKSRKEAESATNREHVWDYYTAALETRLQPEADGTPPARLVCLTRWHPDDLGGRIQELDSWKQGKWLHINFPAIEEVEVYERKKRWLLPDTHPQYVPSKEDVPEGEQDYSGHYFKAEKALWHERFPLEVLKEKQVLNPRDFEALYQQNPYLKGGNIIKQEWWNWYDPSALPERFVAVIVGVDTAFKKTETADYSALFVAGLAPSGDIYVLNINRGRYDFPELKQQCRAENMRWRGQGLRGFHIEDKASGQSLIQELKRESGMIVIPVKVSADKVTRINAVTPLIYGGRVWLPKGAAWVDAFIEETLAFPEGANDDQCDAMSIALDALSRLHVDARAMDFSVESGQSLHTLMKHNESTGSALDRLLNSSLNAAALTTGTTGKIWGQ